MKCIRVYKEKKNLMDEKIPLLHVIWYPADRPTA